MDSVRSCIINSKSSIAYERVDYFQTKPVNLYGLEYWIIRNLLTYKNCFMKYKYYKLNEKIFKKLFGVKGHSIRCSDSKNCIVSITDKAKQKARLLIY